MNTKRKIVITCALPYANGPLHLGHMFEGLYADFWVRFQKMRGHDVLFMCADDTHGTPIMVEARKNKITPEMLIEQIWNSHVQDFKGFQVAHTHYSSTNSKTNQELCEYFYEKMKSKNNLGKKSINQLYCDHDKMFLPDRFVKGTCPKCGAKDQYGDSCDICAATYGPSDMKDAYCSVCGTAPTTKASEQVMFHLDHYKDFLKNWIQNNLAREVSNKMLEWFNEPLRDWDISRNDPYFGFKIPGYSDKYFYVWVDAPMGYLSSTKDYCQKNNLNFDDYWVSNEKSEAYHIIGKDIVYFHTLFWPALLKAADFRTPTSVWVHGHIMVNGEKMSKSKGTYLSARVYLDHLDPMYLRYYFASKISNSMDDIDFNLEDFEKRVNSDLIGKITNLASRGAQMLGGKLDGIMSDLDQDGLKMVLRAQQKGAEIATHYENREFVKAINEIRALADEANRYFDEKAPWKTLECSPSETKMVLTSTLNLFRLLAIYLKPVLPEYVQNVEKLFNEEPYSWDSIEKLVTNKPIAKYNHLASRIDPLKIKAMMESNKKELAERAERDRAASESSKVSPTPSAAAKSTVTTPQEIEISTFDQVDLRIAQIVKAESVEGADKLLRLEVSLGPMGNRQIFAGIKSAYAAEKLTGKLVVVVANLKPRKMKFGMSEGMALAASDPDPKNATGLFLVSPDSGAKPGDKVK